MAEKQNRHPDPPEHNKDCERGESGGILKLLRSTYNKVVNLFNLAKDILSTVLAFKDEAVPLLHKIHHDTKHLSILLPTLETLAVTQQRIEQKVNEMAIDLTKANAGLESLNASFNEIVAEFAALKDQINDPASQAAVDAFGDKLTAMATSFHDINPDLPPPPPPEGVTSSGRDRRRQ